MRRFLFLRRAGAMQVGLAIVLLLCLADSALALDMEFHTYNGFGPVTQAFRKLALIFSDAGYVGLFFTATVLGLVFGAMAFMAKMATGVRLVPLVWAWPVLFGVVLYLGLFVPKGSITVYDPVLNRFDTIGGIPNGVVATAGILNKIEQGLVDIIDTAAVPGSRYQETAGGIGFSTLKAAMTAGPKDGFAKESMARYFKDCAMFEMVRPGTSLSADTMLYGTSDFMPELAKGDNPALFTVYFDAANPQGQTMTCQAAWAKLFPIYNNAASFDNAVKAVCGASLFDPASAAELSTCKNLISGTLSQATKAAVTPENFIRQASLTRLIFQVLDQAAPQSAMLMQINRQVVSSGLGMAAAINEWLPVMRAIMTAVAIGLIPFLALFLPTPLVGKALSVMAGFFVFLATWGISDAILHGAALDYAVEAFEDIRQSGLGLYACVNFPETSTKALAMFGIVRSSGIMLASFLTMMLIRFGGHAMAMMAGSLQSTIQGAGARAGAQLTPEGHASAMDQQISATVPLEMANHYGYSPQAASRQWQAHKGVQSSAADWQTLDAARAAGAIPEGMGNIEAAKSLFTANRSIGSNEGPVQMTTGHNGAMVFTTSQAMTEQGFVKHTQTGMDKASVATYTGGAGTMVTEGREGQETVTSAKVRNMDLSFARRQERRNIEKAAHSLSNNENYTKLLSRVKQDSQTSTEAKSFGNQLSNAEQEKWAKSVDNGSAFEMMKDENVRKVLESNSSMGLNFAIVKAGGGLMIQGTGIDGEAVKVSISAKEAQSFDENRQRIRSEALTEALQSSRNLAYADSISKSIGASEAHSYLREAQSINSDAVSYNNNQETAFVKSYAAYRYGSDSPENVQKAMTFLNSQAIGSRDDQRHLESLANDFLNGRFSVQMNETDKNIHNESQAVTHGLGSLRSQSRTELKEVITPVEVASLHGDLGDPNRQAVESRFEERQQFVERERSGDGRIQTGVGGMIGQGIDKIDRGIGKIVGKPDHPPQDITKIGAPDRPGSPPPPGSNVVEQTPAAATFEEALKKEKS